MTAALDILDVVCAALIVIFLVAALGYLRGWGWLP